MFPCSTSTHIFVNQQVEAHYRKLNLAKSCIDNKTPHSVYTNPKAKGQGLRKNYLRPGAVVRRNENPQRSTPSSFHSDDPAVDEIVAELLKNYKDRDFTLLRPYRNTGKLLNHLEISSARSSSVNSLYKSRLPLRDPPADVLELHRNSFTEVKAYCPRTLKSAVSSKIRTLDCYNPPKRRQLTNATNSQEVLRQASGNSKKNASSPRISSALDLTTSGQSPTSLQAGAQFRGDVLQSPSLILEEIEYLNFLSAVTSEVLQKRQFSNNQLTVVFRKHLENSSSKLTKDQRLKAIRQIGQQLNLPPEVIAASTNCGHQQKLKGEADALDAVVIGGTGEWGESTVGGGSNLDNVLHAPPREVRIEQSEQLDGPALTCSKEKKIMHDQTNTKPMSSHSMVAKSPPQPSEVLFDYRDEISETPQSINPASTITLESQDVNELLDVLEIEDVSAETDDGDSYSENHYANESFAEDDEVDD